MFGRPARQLLDWLGSGGTRRRTGAPIEKRHPGDTPQLEKVDFEKRLKAALQAEGTANAGRILVMDLKKIKLRLGKNWSQTEERVQSYIGSTLDAELGPEDFFTALGELNYVIVFGTLSAEAAKIKIHSIADKILEKIFGAEKELDTLRIKSAVRQVDGKVIFKEEASLEELCDALDEVDGMITDSASLEAAGPASEFQSVSQDEVDEVKRFIQKLQDERAHATPSDAGGGAAAGSSEERPHEKWATKISRRVDRLKSQYHRIGDGDSELSALIKTELKLLEDELKTLEISQAGQLELPDEDFLDDDVRTLVIPGGRGHFSRPPKGIDIRYRPVWSVDQKVFGIYSCEAVFDYGDQTEAAEDWIQEGATPESIAGVDKIGLQRIILKLNELDHTDLRHFYGIPVHLSTLSKAASQKDFLKLGYLIPEKWRDYVVWELLGLDSGGWPSHLATRVDSLRPLGKAVTLRLPDDSWGYLMNNLRDVKEAGLFGVSVDVARLKKNERDILAGAARLIETANACHLRTNFRNVNTKTLAAGLIRAGATFVSGSVFGVDLESPTSDCGPHEISVS